MPSEEQADAPMSQGRLRRLKPVVGCGVGRLRRRSCSPPGERHERLVAVRRPVGVDRDRQRALVPRSRSAGEGDDETAWPGRSPRLRTAPELVGVRRGGDGAAGGLRDLARAASRRRSPGRAPTTSMRTPGVLGLREHSRRGRSRCCRCRRRAAGCCRWPVVACDVQGLEDAVVQMRPGAQLRATMIALVEVVVVLGRRLDGRHLAGERDQADVDVVGSGVDIGQRSVLRRVEPSPSMLLLTSIVRTEVRLTRSRRSRRRSWPSPRPARRPWSR